MAPLPRLPPFLPTPSCTARGLLGPHVDTPALRFPALPMAPEGPPLGPGMASQGGQILAAGMRLLEGGFWGTQVWPRRSAAAGHIPLAPEEPLLRGLCPISRLGH